MVPQFSNGASSGAMQHNSPELSTRIAFFTEKPAGSKVTCFTIAVAVLRGARSQASNEYTGSCTIAPEEAQSDRDRDVLARPGAGRLSVKMQSFVDNSGELCCIAPEEAPLKIGVHPV